MLNFPFMRHRSRAIQPICPLVLPLNTDHRAIRTRCPLNNSIIYSTSSFNSFINIQTLQFFINTRGTENVFSSSIINIIFWPNYFVIASSVPSLITVFSTMPENRGCFYLLEAATVVWSWTVRFTLAVKSRCFFFASSWVPLLSRRSVPACRLWSHSPPAVSAPCLPPVESHCSAAGVYPPAVCGAIRLPLPPHPSVFSCQSLALAD